MEITLRIVLQSESVKHTESALDRWITKVSNFLSGGKSFMPKEMKG